MLVFLFALYSCKGAKSGNELPLSASISQKDYQDPSHKIVINIDSIGQISIDGNYAHVDSLRGVLHSIWDAKKLDSSDSTEILWIMRVHPMTKMGVVVDVKKELIRLGQGNIKYEKSP